jgi:hypothetical protein
VRVQDPGRQQPQNDLLIAGVDRVAGVVTALRARDDGKMLREQIDDLAFAFISPLRAYHSNVHNSTHHTLTEKTDEDDKTGSCQMNYFKFSI